MSVTSCFEANAYQTMTIITITAVREMKELLMKQCFTVYMRLDSQSIYKVYWRVLRNVEEKRLGLLLRILWRNV